MAKPISRLLVIAPYVSWRSFYLHQGRRVARIVLMISADPARGDLSGSSPITGWNRGRCPAGEFHPFRTRSRSPCHRWVAKQLYRWRWVANDSSCVGLIAGFQVFSLARAMFLNHKRSIAIEFSRLLASGIDSSFGAIYFKLRAFRVPSSAVSFIVAFISEGEVSNRQSTCHGSLLCVSSVSSVPCWLCRSFNIYVVDSRITPNLPVRWKVKQIKTSFVVSWSVFQPSLLER
jgi:hypothetical protein